jgi:hypothetical protein
MSKRARNGPRATLSSNAGYREGSAAASGSKSYDTAVISATAGIHVALKTAAKMDARFRGHDGFVHDDGFGAG